MKLENACKYTLNVHGTDSDGNPTKAAVGPGDTVEVDTKRGEKMLDSGDWSRPGKAAKKKTRATATRSASTRREVRDADTDKKLETGEGDGKGKAEGGSS